MTYSQVAAGDEWVDLPDAASRLGFDSATLLRLVNDGDLPVMQVKGKRRTAHRVPGDLVEKARRVVFAGGQVELREFAPVGDPERRGGGPMMAPRPPRRPVPFPMPWPHTRLTFRPVIGDALLLQYPEVAEALAERSRREETTGRIPAQGGAAK